MSRPPHVIPLPLLDRAFTPGEALLQGVSATQLSRGPYTSLLSGIWQPVDRMLDPDPRQELLRVLPSLLLAIPGSAASHVTAAQLHGMRLPTRLSSPTPIHLMGPSEFLRSRRSGLVGHRTALRRGQAAEMQGIMTTRPLRTVVDLAGLTAKGRPVLTDDELVAVLDGMIRRHRTGFHRGEVPLCSREDAETGLALLRGRRGVARIRCALERAEEGIDSPLETRVRLCLIEHGLEGWETDLEVIAANGGRFWPDLADRSRRLSIQVEGAHHDDPAQRKRDITRQRLTAAAGWSELRVTADDLVERRWPQPPGPPPLITLVRRARQAAERAI